MYAILNKTLKKSLLFVSYRNRLLAIASIEYYLALENFNVFISVELYF